MHPSRCTVVLCSWKTKFLNPKKFPFWKMLLSFDSNNRMFCFFTPQCLFFYFSVAVKNLLNQGIHLSSQKINCLCLQRVPPIQCSACSSTADVQTLFFFFRFKLSSFAFSRSSGNTCSCSPAVQICRGNIGPGR